MSEWRETTLGEILNFRRGHDLPKQKRKNGNIPIISSSGITGYHSDYQDVGPGIITGRYGTIGQVFFVEGPYWPLNTTLYVDDFKDNDPLFLSYFLRSIDFEKYNDKSTVPGINRNHLHLEEVSVPQVEEQQAIASILSSLDDKIDLLHRQNQTLEQMAETLFRQWFVEDADVSWEEGILGEEFDFTMGQSPPGSSFNEDGIGTPMYQGNRDFGFRFPKKRVFTTEPKRFAEKYDTLISVRAPVGEQNMAIEKCCIGRGVAAFRYKAKPAYYTYTFFKLKSIMDEIKQFNETGTVFGSISKNDFQEMEVTIPPLSEVEIFQNEVKPIDDKIITNCTQIRTLTQIRDTLLPKLMNGEVRIAN